MCWCQVGPAGARFAAAACQPIMAPWLLCCVPLCFADLWFMLCWLDCLLLQQSLNMLQGETKPIRRHIEARFDEIKAITESPQPFLDMEFSSW